MGNGSRFTVVIAGQKIAAIALNRWSGASWCNMGRGSESALRGTSHQKGGVKQGGGCCWQSGRNREERWSA